MAENTTVSVPFFAPAGLPSVYFTVREGLPPTDALEGASLFLGAAGDLACELPCSRLPVEARQWAIVYLIEMAKALVDAVVSNSMEASHG
ncbi:MAG: DUF3077 domain-containing protein [Candidatus Accumulibacter sp.]|uniref:DUF3077 domain-containing protein n=1 Tax=Accumulibacter sp. TaxID=2053492 RepID=UPI001A375620|nr:DUF3077 domain-containing protein [Accumulibacter sp.]MBL8401257.1 DUF3077 domain-containing protein [Accumulibacter sp.]MBO3708974.1 DUF3077 domain-containing protein [Accumulibacter sp.]HRE19202.1 DUF3077 domain-containing protein [Rhodocyclaceae bacterium]